MAEKCGVHGPQGICWLTWGHSGDHRLEEWNSSGCPSPAEVFWEQLAQLGREMRRDEEAYRHFLGNPGAGTSVARAEWRAMVSGYKAAAEAIEKMLTGDVSDAHPWGR